MDKLTKENSQAKEFTLKDAIEFVKESFFELLRCWKLIILITLPFVLYFLYSAMTKEPTYRASLTFMVNEDEGSGGGMSQIFSSFGIPGIAAGKNNLDKILELARSRRIIQNVIFDKVSINSSEDYIANHIINIYDFHEKWEDDTTGLKNYLFEKDSLPLFNRTDNTALKRVHKKIVGSKDVKGLLKTSYTPETGIMEFVMKTENEKLSIEFSKILYHRILEFYVKKTIEKQQQTYDIMRLKLDTILQEMSSAEYQLASFRDRNLGLWSDKDKLREVQLQRDVRVLNERYALMLKNLEIADFTLKNKVPFVQLIDEPIPPIKPEMESKIISILIGGFLGGFLAVVFVIARKIFRDALA